MKNKINRKALILFLVLFVTPSIIIAFMGHLDYQRLVEDKNPIFNITRTGVADGGSTEYFGFMYLLIDHGGYSREERPDWAQSDGWAFDKGPQISHILPWLWWANKSDIKTVIDTSRINEEDMPKYFEYINQKQKNKNNT